MDCKRSAASRLHHNALHAMRHPLCLAGKVPKLHQFALTPQQLVMREMQQEDELDSSSGSGSLRAAEGAATRRRSLALGSADELQMLAAQLQTRTRWVVWRVAVVVQLSCTDCTRKPSVQLQQGSDAGHTGWIPTATQQL